MEVTPKAMILINGADVTGHTETVQFVDKEDNRADEVTITLDRNFARPSYKDVVLLYLGYKESGLYFCGKFFVQTSDRTDRFLRVKATSADLAGSIKERRTQSYEKISLCDIVGMIAGRNGLAAKCDMSDVFFDHIAQTNESDLHFLTRLAERYNAIFNIKNATLIFLKKQNVPTFVINEKECASYSIKYANRTLYKSVKAIWWNTKENKKEEIVVGSGGPVYELKWKFKTKEEAMRRAGGMLERLGSGVVKASFTMTGRNIVAGGKAILQGFGGDDGTHVVKSGTHTFGSGGYEVKIETESMS